MSLTYEGLERKLSSAKNAADLECYRAVERERQKWEAQEDRLQRQVTELVRVDARMKRTLRVVKSQCLQQPCLRPLLWVVSLGVVVHGGLWEMAGEQNVSQGGGGDNVCSLGGGYGLTNSAS